MFLCLRLHSTVALKSCKNLPDYTTDSQLYCTVLTLTIQNIRNFSPCAIKMITDECYQTLTKQQVIEQIVVLDVCKTMLTAGNHHLTQSRLHFKQLTLLYYPQTCTLRTHLSLYATSDAASTNNGVPIYSWAVSVVIICCLSRIKSLMRYPC